MKWNEDEVCIVLDQHAYLDFYIASSLKQQPSGRHVAPLGHIILIPSQPVFALSPLWCVLSGEATNNNFIVIGLIWSGLKPMICHTRGEHYTTDDVWVFRTTPLMFECLGPLHYIPLHMILWQTVLLLEDTGVLGKNPPSSISHWQIKCISHQRSNTWYFKLKRRTLTITPIRQYMQKRTMLKLYVILYLPDY